MMNKMGQFLVWTLRKKRFDWGCKLGKKKKKSLSPYPSYHSGASFVCLSHPGIDYLVQPAPLAGLGEGAAALCSEGIQELCNLAQRHFTPKRDMTQGRKRITGVIKVVQFDNAEMKFCLVTSQGDKETEDHLRPFLPKIPQPWHLLLKAEEAGGSAEQKRWSLSGHSIGFSPDSGVLSEQPLHWTVLGKDFPFDKLTFCWLKKQGRDWAPSEGDSMTPPGQQSTRGFISIELIL